MTGPEVSNILSNLQDQNILLHFLLHIRKCFLLLTAEYELDFFLPADYVIYSSLNKNSSFTLAALNFDELADSPIIASNSAQFHSLKISNINFSFCFQGEIKINWERLLKDFTLFIEYQIKLFGSFPHNDFLFLVYKYFVHKIGTCINVWNYETFFMKMHTIC